MQCGLRRGKTARRQKRAVNNVQHSPCGRPGAAGSRQAAADHGGRARRVPGAGLRRRKHGRDRPAGRRLQGTLYVYFDSKEALFEAIVEEECQAQAEQVFALDSNDHDVEAVLTRLGYAFVRFLCRPGGQSSLRTVISISERMPAIGKQFYETGPATGIARLSRYLEDQVAGGVLAIRTSRWRPAVPRFLPINAIQTAPLQLRWSADRRTDQPCGRHRGAHLLAGARTTLMRKGARRLSCALPVSRHAPLLAEIFNAIWIPSSYIF